MLGLNVKESDYYYDLEIPFFSTAEAKFVSEFLSNVDVVDNLGERLEFYARSNYVLLDDAQKDRLLKLVTILLSEYSVFEKALRDDLVEEIAVIGLEKPIYVYLKGRGWLKTNLEIIEESFFVELVNRLARQSGKRITKSLPHLNANIKEIGRLHATMPPISDYELTIRKFNKLPFSLSEIVASKMLNNIEGGLIWLLIMVDSSMLISGNTASGKTTFLNSLTQLFSSDERIIVIEETRELHLANEHVVYLTEYGDIKMLQLIWDSLRMRPDRVILGEVRTKDEFRALVESILAGQARSFYATLHAISAGDLIKRISTYNLDTEVFDAVDCIINFKRYRFLESSKLCERRELREIYFPRSDFLIRRIADKDKLSEVYERLDNELKFKLSALCIDTSKEFVEMVCFLGEKLSKPSNFFEFLTTVKEVYGDISWREKK